MPPKSASTSRPATGGAAAGRPKSGAAAGSAATGKRSALGQAASPAAAAGVAAADELRKRAELLERSLRAEEAARNLAQLERDKVAAFWEVTRRELGDARGAARVKDRELEEAQDQHAAELKVYRQRLKHLLYEHAGAAARLAAQGEAALKEQADAFAAQEARLCDDKRALKAHAREQEAGAELLIRQFRLDNAKQASALRAEFEGRARVLQAKYEAQLKAAAEGAEARYAADLADADAQRAAHVSDLMARHAAAFKEMRAYYNQVTHSNLDLIKALKDEIAELKRAEAARERLVGDVLHENKRLAEPLSQAVAEAEALRAAAAGAERDRAVLAGAKARLAAAERSQRALEWQLEVTQQRLERVMRERDQVVERLEVAVLATEQHAALRTAVLERRLEAAESRAALRSASSHGASAGLASRAASAAPPAPGAAQEGQGDGPRRRARSSPPDWVAAMLQAALLTPLPDGDADVLEDDAPAQLLGQIEELEAADAAELAPAGAGAGAGASAAALPGSKQGLGIGAGSNPEAASLEPLAALEAKLSQAALGASEAATAALGGQGVGGAEGELRIAAHRPSQQ